MRMRSCLDPLQARCHWVPPPLKQVALVVIGGRQKAPSLLPSTSALQAEVPYRFSLAGKYL